MTIILDQLQDKSTALDELRQRLSDQMRDRNRVGLGWLRFTCSIKYLTYWKKRVQRFFKVKLRSRGRGWQGYVESWEAGLGILIAFTPQMTEAERQAAGVKSSPNEGRMTVDIPQGALDSLTDRNHLGLWIDIFGCDSVKFTRVDIYYDDYCKIISPEALDKACSGGGVGVPRFDDIGPTSRRSLRTGKSYGYTVYIGSKKSDRKLRYYDKALESEGKQDCYRLELEDKGQYAEKYSEYMLEALGKALDQGSIADSVAVLRDAYKALLKGSVSFHEIPVGKSPEDLPRNWASRSPLVWWWQEMMAGMEPAKLTLDRVEPSLQKAVAWIRSQVASSLALIRTSYSHWNMPFREWLNQLLDEGEARWQAKHWKMMEEAILTSPAY